MSEPAAPYGTDPAGTCDLCGRYDHHLRAGVGACCQGRLTPLGPDTYALHPAGDPVPLAPEAELPAFLRRQAT